MSFRSIPYSNLSDFSRTWQAITSGDVSDGLYARPPANVDACRAACEQTLAQGRPWKELAELFEQSGRRYGVPDETLSRLGALAEGRAAMVVTGQQVGYLGGPLYTFLKAYHTTRLAAELEKILNVPVLPVFWLEGEDHDLQEIRDAHYLDRDAKILTTRFTPARIIEHYEAGYYEVDAGAHVEEMAASLDVNDENGLALLRTAYTQTTMSDGMGRLLASLLGNRGLLIIEGSEKTLRQMALPLWEKVVGRGRGLTDLLAARSAELRAKEWTTPLSPTPDSYLFYLTCDNHIRCAVFYDGRLQHPDGNTAIMPPEVLLRSVREHSTVVSPKAALRPLFQDFILPTIAYVAGPGELDYHAQIAPFYDALGVCAPSLFPRWSATVMDARTGRNVERLGFPLEQFLKGEKPQLLQSLLRERDENKIFELLSDSRRNIADMYEKLKSELGAIDRTLEGAAEIGAGRSLHPLEQLREKAFKAMKQKHATDVMRLQKCLNVLHPQDSLSERVLCTGYYLIRHGPAPLLAALDELPLENKEHYVVQL
ncbi:bacillithiol biosynthesis cysteine-adding enzyme BshC [candidate division KSB1 bacterium]|nr:MAG: bacillithiol biosynthesis cysteine-adding enzyme BshC [candidate division KSB1 bacterium]